MNGYLDTRFVDGRVRKSDYPWFLRDKIADHLGAPPQYVADVGAGSGDFLAVWGYKKNAASEFPRLTAIDVAFSPLLKSQSMRIGMRAVLSFSRANFDALESRYDLVFCKSVVEHMADPADFVEGLKCLMAEKGHLVLMTPDWRYYCRVFYDEPTHVRPFDLNSICSLLEIHGFEIVYRGLECQHSGLDSSKLQRFVGHLLTGWLREDVVCRLADRLNWPWLRWAKLRTAMIIATVK